MISDMWLKILPWATTVLLGWLLLEAREDIGEEREQCNTRVEAGARQAERAAREAERLNFEQVLAARDAREAELLSEIDNLGRQREILAEEVTTVEAAVRQLTLESFDEDELPDSGACLNVYVLRDSVRGMQLGQSCAGARDSGDNPGTLYPGPGGADTGEPAHADITYSDVLNLWARDRASLIQSNCQLRSIRNLTNGDAEARPNTHDQ